MTDETKTEKPRFASKGTAHLRALCGDLEDESVWKDAIPPGAPMLEVRSRLEHGVETVEREIRDLCAALRATAGGAA